MNPRHRRLLIPGLLIALLVVVLVAALSDRAGAAESQPTTACVVTDERIDEQSGLAVSRVVADTAYMVNDSGSRPEVYAVDLLTCDVVGTTRLEGVEWRDPEALALDGDGTLWIADTGDNRARRDAVALYAMAEPGRGDGTERPSTHRFTYPDGPVDAEALLVHPDSGAKWVVTKGWTGGELHALPDDWTGGDAVAEPTGVSMPMLVTDASMTPDGRYAVVRTYLKAHVYDVEADFAAVERIGLPAQPQGETVAVEPSGTSLLVGSEGVGQPLFRVPLGLPSSPPSASPDPSEPTTTEAAGPAASGGLRLEWVAGAIGAVVVLVGTGLLVTRRHRRP